MAQYANINNVYSIVKDVMNKQQLGFITPAQFNVFAPQAEKELVDETLELIFGNTQRRLRNLETLNRDFEKGYEDDIHTLLVYNESQSASSGTNVFDLPDRYYYIKTIEYQGKEVDVMRPQEASKFINSYYSSPNENYAIAVIASNKITVYPTQLNDDLFLTYYKNPMGSQNGVGVNQPPSWQFTQVGEDLLYNAVTSVDFELPKTMEHKLAYKILTLAGMSLREEEIVNFSNTQEQKDKVTE